MLAMAASIPATPSASDRVRATIMSVPSFPECQVVSDRTTAVKEGCARVLEAISMPGDKCDRFNQFAKTLNEVLKVPVQKATAKCTQSLQSQRAKLWMAFHEIRASTLPKVWRSFLSDIGCEDMTDPLFPQLVNQHLFEEIVKSQYEICTSEQRPVRRVLSKDEENVIRYACGYVSMRLLRKFKRTQGNKAASFVECLSHMAIEGPEESLLKYTQEWIKKLDRGGLFQVNDGCYHLFAAIEIALGDKLKLHLQSSTTQYTTAKSSLIHSVACDEDVQFYWAMQSVDRQ